MDKLADGLQRLGEDDLLQVVQMVHDNKAPDSYTKNDTERMFCVSSRRLLVCGLGDANLTPCRLVEGEFHVDLYTLPDNLVKMLWDFTQEKGGV